MIVVLDYGVGNIHSVIKALKLFYDDVVFTSDKNVLKKARGLVLPGDGHFQAAMENLRKLDLITAIQDFVESGKSLLGICIGFQILFTDSDEVYPESGKKVVNGLNFIPGNVRKFVFPKGIRIPHMGWNVLLPDAEKEPLPEFLKSYMYFIHSYRPVNVERKYVVTWTEYGGELFPSTVRRENIWGCQYHPEKSHKHGLEFLKNWIRQLS